MKVGLTTDTAYVIFNNGLTICLGGREEVETATQDELIKIILESLALYQFNEILTSKNLILH